MCLVTQKNDIYSMQDKDEEEADKNEGKKEYSRRRFLLAKRERESLNRGNRKQSLWHETAAKTTPCVRKLMDGLCSSFKRASWI